MKVTIQKGNYNAAVVLRRLGYALYRNRQGEESYVRRIYGEDFPRFHLYVNDEDDTVLHCAVHLDQRKPVYRGSTAHGGDYDSPEVAAEVARLRKA